MLSVRAGELLLTRRCQERLFMLEDVRSALNLRRTQMRNAVVWSEIAVSDLKRATTFYEKLLDGKLKLEDLGPHRIAVFPHAEDGVGGCLVHGANYKPSSDGTLTYLAATPGIDVALERARAAG